jgi:hypothetical protein
VLQLRARLVQDFAERQRDPLQARADALEFRRGQSREEGILGRAVDR